MQRIEHFLYKAKKHQNLFLGIPFLCHIFTQKEATLMLRLYINTWEGLPSSGARVLDEGNNLGRISATLCIALDDVYTQRLHG
jgi:hypothetical protein